MIFTNRSGKIRLYDSTATPFYLQLIFDEGDFSGPYGIPKTEELLQLHRGTVDANSHYIQGPEDAILAPVEISFSGKIQDTSHTGYLKDWLRGNTVNSQTIVTTKGDTQRVSGTVNPSFADSSKKCANVEIFWDESGTDYGLKYAEVYFPLDQIQIRESGDGVILSLRGQCYGTITDISAFTAGTDVTA